MPYLRIPVKYEDIPSGDVCIRKSKKGNKIIIELGCKGGNSIEATTLVSKEEFVSEKGVKEAERTAKSKESAGEF